MSNDLTTMNQNQVNTDNVGGITFVTFASAKSPRFTEWAAAIPGLKEPDAVLVRSAPYLPIRLSPFKAFYLAGKQYWIEAEDDGTLVRVSLSEDRDDYALKEVIETVLLVFHDNQLVPARMTFRTTKCPAAKTMAKTLEIAQTPEWARISPAHAQSLKVPFAGGRFTATLTATARTAKQSARKYYAASASIAPTTEADVSLLAESLKDETFMAGLEAAKENLAYRISNLDSLAQES